MFIKDVFPTPESPNVMTIFIIKYFYYINILFKWGTFFPVPFVYAAASSGLTGFILFKYFYQLNKN